MPDVVCLGQFTADVVIKPVESVPEKGKAAFVDNISLSNGGCACNTAMALGKLGIATAVIGMLGRDAFGDFLIQTMQKTGLDVAGMIQDQSVNTSSTAVLVAPDGERSFLHYFGGNAKISESQIDYDLIESAKLLHVAAAFLVPGLDGQPMANILARAQKAGVTTMLDTAWDAHGRWMQLLEPCLYHLDYFVPSLEEAQMISNKKDPAEIADFFVTQYGIGNVIIKLGPDGCHAKTSRKEFSLPAFPVEKVVDTLGAGDCFVAGLIAGLINGWNLKKACQLATAAGAANVSAPGYTGLKPLPEIMNEYSLND